MNPEEEATAKAIIDSMKQSYDDVMIGCLPEDKADYLEEEARYLKAQKAKQSKEYENDKLLKCSVCHLLTPTQLLNEDNECAGCQKETKSFNPITGQWYDRITKGWTKKDDDVENEIRDVFDEFESFKKEVPKKIKKTIEETHKQTQADMIKKIEDEIQRVFDVMKDSINPDNRKTFKEHISGLNKALKLIQGD